MLVRGTPVAEVATGAMIGDVDVLGRRPYRARVVAATPMTVWRIEAQHLDRLLSEAPTFVRALARDLSHRLRAVESSITSGR